MNLFCFSLEGSMDSLYEPVRNNSGVQECIIPNRMCSQAVLPKRSNRWRGSVTALPMELSQPCRTNSVEKKRKSLSPKSTSENKALDNINCNAYQQFSKNSLNEEMRRDVRQSEFQVGEDRVRQPDSERGEKKLPIQMADTGTETGDSMGTLKRIRKLTGEKRRPEGGQGTSEMSAHISDSLLKDDRPVISSIGLAKKPEEKLGKVAVQRVTENNIAPVVQTLISESCSGGTAEFPLPWDIPYHTCRRPLTEYRMYNYDFTLPRSKDWNRFEYLIQEHRHRVDLAPSRIIRSITDLDICDQRSTSFGRFDAFRNQPSPFKPEENGGILPVDGESGNESCDQSKPGSIGKKMKAISMTMRKKMGRKYVKALSEEMVDGVDHGGEGEGETEGKRPLGKGSRRTSNSLESLNSRQSSSSVVTSGSDSSTNRDSLRLEEDVPYTGHFCGRARVHTDFVPSPYDTDSLKLKIGDFIDIISKPPMGIWTGMLNNKVGNFKFIYVDIIVEKEAEPERVRPQRQSTHLTLKTLQELLESLHLEEYTSSLLLNGYQTVEDLRDLKEKHLIELNVTDPDDRHRLLAAADGVIDAETQGENKTEDTPEAESRSDSLKLEDDCPRDSGCYMTSESSDNSREDTESHPSTPS
ncbi:hypothetical protein SKAU_G00277350 [Synaphobranchus kaupii]|uniref:SAM domain-containing protein SAMSN-1 n=1 Tax=Synaphobranchus kaupii TaxID=118154 RepID=A0A9Q1F1I4_SYNKA|nr:hypothetical protein SKAU_G00277350 [Synaphobranchus kaupii]